MLTFEMPTIKPPKRSLFAARDAVLSGCEAVTQQFGVPMPDGLFADALAANTDTAIAQANRNPRPAIP